MRRSFHFHPVAKHKILALGIAGLVVLASGLLLPAHAFSQPSLIGDSITIELDGLPVETVVVTDAPGPEAVFSFSSDEFIEVDIEADAIRLTFLDYTGQWAWVPDQSNPFPMDFTGIDFPFFELGDISIVGSFFANTEVTGEVLDGSSLRLHVPNGTFYENAPQIVEIYVQLLLPLESRLGGLAYYDPNLDVTWSADASINGVAAWGEQLAWAGNLTLAGLDGWRLPSADLDGDGIVASCAFPAECADNEMHFLGLHRGITVAAPAPFSNVSANGHWSGTTYAADPGEAWLSDFLVANGAAGTADKSLPAAAFAVFPGDLSGLMPVARLRSPDVWEVAVSGDGTTLLSVNIGPAITGINRGSIDIFNTAIDEVLGSVALGLGFPLDAAITHDASLAYVAVSRAFGNLDSFAQNRIDVIDLATQTILTSIPIGGEPQGPAGVALSQDESRLYVAHVGSKRIDIIDTASQTRTGEIPLDSAVTQVAFGATGEVAYAVSREPAVLVTVINALTDRTITTINTSLQSTPERVSIALDHDRLFAYATSLEDAGVSMIDIDPASSNAYREVAVIPTSSREIRDSAVSADGTRLYVSSTRSEAVLFIDIDSASPAFRMQVGSLPLGAGPFSIAVQPVPPVAMYVAIRDEEWIIPVDFSFEDYDGDGLVNRSDNCTASANPTQLDADGDSHGNACDPDVAPQPNDCVVNFSDLGALKAAMFTAPTLPGWNPHADFDGNSAVNFLDLAIMKQLFFMSPGLSGLPDACR